MEADQCMKCGKPGLVAGAVVWNAPLRFKPAGLGSFKRGEEVKAAACNSCGFVELHLVRQDSGK